jgi:hypothetical protein
MRFTTVREQLEYELSFLRKDTLDPDFVGYLDMTKGQLSETPDEAVADLRLKVIKNYQKYCSVMAQKGVNLDSRYAIAIYGEDQPEVGPAPVPAPLYSNEDEETETPAASSAAAPAEAATAVLESAPAEQIETPIQSPVAEEPVTVAQPEAVAVPVTPVQPAPVPQPAPQPQPAPASQPATQPAQSVPPVQPAPAPQPAFTSQAGPAPAPGNVPPYTYGAAPQEPPKKFGGVEFALGGVVLAVIGAFLVLAAGMKLAITYLNDFAQGMMLYAFCVVLFLISELLVRKKIPKFSAVLSAISLSGLLLSTLACRMGLKIFPMNLTILILAVLSVLICIFSFVRKSALFSAVGFVTSFACFVALGTSATPDMFLALVCTALGISLFWAILPANDNSVALVCIEMTANVIFLYLCSYRTLNGNGTLGGDEVRLIFIIASWLIFQIVYLIGMIRSASLFSEKAGGAKAAFQTSGIFYFIGAMFYLGRILNPLRDYPWENLFNADRPVLAGAVGLLGLIVPALIIFVILLARKDSRWNAPYFSALVIAIYMGFDFFADTLLFVILICALTLLVRVMAKTHADDMTMKITDLLMVILISAYGFMDQQEIWFSLILAATVLIAILLNTGFTTATQIILTVGLAMHVSSLAPDDFRVPVAMAVWFVMVLFLNAVAFVRPDSKVIYNWFAFGAEILLLLVINDVDPLQPILIWGLCFIIGLGAMITLLHPAYELPFARKYIVVSVYMTYMALIFPDLPGGIYLSGIWMIIALISVVLGFAANQVSIRVYGLVLALLVCGKIILMDFAYFNSLQKTVLYFVIGIIALTISGIYFLLERKESKELHDTKDKENEA